MHTAIPGTGIPPPSLVKEQLVSPVHAQHWLEGGSAEDGLPGQG